jgi:hypothetical protein
VVSGHGLAVALESLAARAPVPVQLTVELHGRLNERVEVAAYYVVAESLANMGKLPRPHRRRSPWRAPTASSLSRSSTTVSAARTASAAPDCAAPPTAWRLSPGDSGCGHRAAEERA